MMSNEQLWLGVGLVGQAFFSMGAATAVVRAQIVGSDDGPGILGHKHRVARRVPVGEGVRTRDVTRDGVGFPGAEGRLENAPDSVVVSRFGLPDQHDDRDRF